MTTDETDLGDASKAMALSFLDVISCGLGAVILLALVIAGARGRAKADEADGPPVLVRPAAVYLEIACEGADGTADLGPDLAVRAVRNGQVFPVQPIGGEIGLTLPGNAGELTVIAERGRGVSRVYLLKPADGEWTFEILYAGRNHWSGWESTARAVLYLGFGASRTRLSEVQPTLGQTLRFERAFVVAP